MLEKKFAREEKLREKEAFGGPWSLKRSNRGVEEDGELASIQLSPDQADNVGEEPIDPPAPGTYEADKKGDIKSLDRLGERNLYLLVRGMDHSGKEVWRFPQGGLRDGEPLHQVNHHVCSGVAKLSYAVPRRLRCVTSRPRLESRWTHGL